MSELFIQPSVLHVPGGLLAGQWGRGVPVPGAPASVNPIPAVGGIATCSNLLQDSPPTLLEQYELYSYAIGWAIFIQPQAADVLTAELALLVNDRVVYTASEAPTAVNEPGGSTGAYASGAWVSDLVNPIQLGARDRLSLRAGAQASAAVTYLDMYVGVQLGPVSSSLGAIPFESTLSYRTLAVPASRRL